MLLNARRLDQEDGTPQMILLAIEDVTERRRSEIIAASLAAIVNSSEDAIIGKAPNGVITSWNKGAERLFGYSSEEAIGKPITMLIPSDHQQEEHEMIECLKLGESVSSFETICLRKDGSPLDISVTISPIKDATGKVIGASRIARDISKRKLADEALRQAHAELRSRAEELSRFNRVAVGREARMIELKKEVNELCQQQGQPVRYPLEFEGEPKENE
jgi:PAS domain S-box-containing protein